MTWYEVVYTVDGDGSPVPSYVQPINEEHIVTHEGRPHLRMADGMLIDMLAWGDPPRYPKFVAVTLRDGEAPRVGGVECPPLPPPRRDVFDDLDKGARMSIPGAVVIDGDEWATGERLPADRLPQFKGGGPVCYSGELTTAEQGLYRIYRDGESANALLLCDTPAVINCDAPDAYAKALSAAHRQVVTIGRVCLDLQGTKDNIAAMRARLKPVLLDWFTL